MGSRIVTFTSDDWCRRVALAKTDEEMKMTTLALELSSEPMAVILRERQESSCISLHPSLEPEILHTRRYEQIIPMLEYI